MQFAVAVVEVNTSQAIPNAPAPQIVLYGRRPKLMKTRRVVSVEVFDEPWVQNEGYMAYYLNTDSRGRTHPWDGTLPPGMVHLRIRVALDTQEFIDAVDGKCRVTIGTHEVDGRVDGSWAT